jgi:3-dehydrosphinganine reductase
LGKAAIHGYSAYGASKWALRGLAEALQMEVKPFGIYVSISYPPDTDTPGYKVEMESKPLITRLLSESGQVFEAIQVASDIAAGSANGQFSISTGLDGWMLRQLHPGMTPLNNLWEVTQQVLFSSLARFIALFYVTAWDRTVAAHVNSTNAAVADKNSGAANVPYSAKKTL